MTCAMPEGICLTCSAPQFAVRAPTNRRRLPPMVGMGVGAHHKTHILELVADLVERPLELR